MTQRISIVGQKHRGFEDSYLPGILSGTPAVLVWEPENEYDRGNAVQVWVNGVHIGYLPKGQNVEVARRIETVGHECSEAPVKEILAADSTGVYPKIHKAIDAKFVRSPNSGYPQIEI